MQLTNAPGKLVLPFASTGGKNSIPTDSQIGITAGAASLVDGFPPLTRTSLAAGGVPPSGLDMNGILYKLSDVVRWANAGGGYAYDAVFAADPNVNGYPKGARVMRSDGVGYWINTVENNTTDPEVAGAAAAGWVPDFSYGATAVSMTNANVTLTPLQYGKRVIVITGLLTANLNLIFPNLVGIWTIVNSTTGAYSITCKTAAGIGVAVMQGTSSKIAGDATSISFDGEAGQTATPGNNSKLFASTEFVNTALQLGSPIIATAGGTPDAITASFSPAVTSLVTGVLYVRAAAANTTGALTFTPNSGVVGTRGMFKGAGYSLLPGDIAGAGHELAIKYDPTLDKWELLNPAHGMLTEGSITYDTAGGTFVVPDNKTTLYLTGCGAGGGGAAYNGATAGGGGGGGGASCIRRAVTVVPGTSYTVTVGTGGAGGAAAGAAGAAGGTTSFGALLTLTGGVGGTSAGAGGGGGAVSGGSGGIAVTGQTGEQYNNDATANSRGGSGGGGIFGSGGLGGGLGTSNSAGAPGGGLGSGGGGGAVNVGASGANGFLTVEW